MKKILSLAILAGLLSFAIGCGGDSSSTTPKVDPKDNMNKMKEKMGDKMGDKMKTPE